MNVHSTPKSGSSQASTHSIRPFTLNIHPSLSSTYFHHLSRRTNNPIRDFNNKTRLVYSRINRSGSRLRTYIRRVLLLLIPFHPTPHNTFYILFSASYHIVYKQKQPRGKSTPSLHPNSEQTPRTHPNHHKRTANAKIRKASTVYSPTVAWRAY